MGVNVVEVIRALREDVLEALQPLIVDGETTTDLDDGVLVCQDGDVQSFTGFYRDRGGYNASNNLFPGTGGGGTAGAILQGDTWTATHAGTLGGTSVSINDTIRARIDAPGQTASNWVISASAVNTSTPSSLTGWLLADGANVYAHPFEFDVDGSTNHYQISRDGPFDAADAAAGGAMSDYLYRFNSGTGALQYHMRSEYVGSFGGYSADFTVGYLEFGEPYVGIGACNGTGTSAFSIRGQRVDFSTSGGFYFTGNGVRLTVLGTDYDATETGLELFSVANDAALVTRLGTAGMASKAYADALVVGLVDDRGNYNASGNTFPASGGSGTAGAILKGDLWTVSVAGTLGGTAVTAGDAIRALIDTPGQTAANWAVTENNFGFTPESSANKSTDTALGSSNTLYPTQGAVKSYVDTGLATKQNSLGFTPLNPANNLSELASVATAKANLLLGDPTEALRGSYHLLPLPSRPRWDIMENIPSNSTGTGWGMGGNDWNASTGNVLSHPGSRTGTNYGNNRARTHCIGPTPVAGTQMAQLRHGTRSPIIRSSVSDNFAYLIFRQRTLPALSQGWAGWKNLSAEHATTAVLQNTVNCIAMGYEQSGGTYEPNWYLYHNDGSGTCTRIDLGANFPTSIEAVYRFYICMEANSGNIAYQVDRLDVWATTSGLLSSNLPSIDSQMFGHLYQSNGGTAVRCEVEAFHHFAAIKN